ncbi:MAG: Phosphate ABC transporter, periplasmic phosphate-binding protein PstS (TC 3.A.1.7.1) [uncultured Thiotrichaceae bacterium]|uniref:Phosphate ABC transporter, periplasmic phosphate-binding protein PstS (TC 3.A.1.7.1) n=1 Tax=uncultured Thiotrichaceae bacterium TaxID=298394 RepID=A0A6S6T4K6_9GAMM|nr:MAG: Phosphate ABC transporter, periplasmic phosphate-binding protein PstS (TC 3.A.1.7.1) [uncultured Thiotrichaceae bacterium]
MLNKRDSKNMKALPLMIALSLGSVVATASANSRDHIDIVGSSTVYPFSTVVAETYGKKTGKKTPKIEATGSGGGMKLFCAGNGIETPDITNASRRIKKSEFDSCQKNGVKDIIEVQIGFDGIAIANAKSAPKMELSTKDLFLALAKQVPGEKAGELIENPYKTWKQVNSALPDTKIEVLGPPPTSGTRDAFAELALEGGCNKVDWIKQLKSDSKAAKKAGDKEKSTELKNKHKEICHTVREDGAYVEAGENDNLIVDKLRANPKALGIFGFSFLDQNSDKVQGSQIDGIDVNFETVADGSYPVSRPLYFYVKKSHVDTVPGIKEFIAEFTDEDTWGEEGYLTDKGLIPLSDEKRAAMAESANGLIPLVFEAE